LNEEDKSIAYLLSEYPEYYKHLIGNSLKKDNVFVLHASVAMIVNVAIKISKLDI